MSAHTRPAEGDGDGALYFSKTPRILRGFAGVTLAFRNAIHLNINTRRWMWGFKLPDFKSALPLIAQSEVESKGTVALPQLINEQFVANKASNQRLHVSSPAHVQAEVWLTLDPKTRFCSLRHLGAAVIPLILTVNVEINHYANRTNNTWR